jgi:hypothetical protein
MCPPVRQPVWINLVFALLPVAKARRRRKTSLAMSAEQRSRRICHFARATRSTALVLGVAAGVVITTAAAQDAGPANTLQELGRQFATCLAKTPLSAGSQVTITFALRRDGSPFGKPRISYSRLEGDAEQRQRFLVGAETAIDSCLPLKVTPALGGAIAGRLFSVTIGRPKAERAI